MKSKMFKNPSGFVYGSGNLVQFRAGRMNLIGKMVHADTRKGLVYVRQADDGLVHFCWKDRDTNKVEDDLILFPEDFEYKRVEQCKTGRVYVMIFKASPRRLFYWMQEVKSNKDEEYCTRINELIKNPPMPSHQRATNGFTGSLFNNMTHEQLMNLLNDVTERHNTTISFIPASTNSRATGAIGTNGSISALLASGNSNTPKRLAPILNGNNVPSSSKKKKPRNTKSDRKSGKVDLNDAFIGFTASKEFLEIISNTGHVKKLAMFLPKIEGESQDPKQLIQNHISSPDFKKTMTDFCEAFPSKILGNIMRSLQLPINAVAAAFSGNLESFLRALEVKSNDDSGENNKNCKCGDKRKWEPENDEPNSKRK